MINAVFHNPKKYPVSVALISRVVKTAGKYERKLKGTAEIVLTDNREIKKLNHLWRGINRPTDVLSFAWGEDNKLKGEVLGQIFISYPKIVSQAKACRVPVKNEFTRILAHGLLHLAGHDHIKASEKKKMFKIQENVAKIIG